MIRFLREEWNYLNQDAPLLDLPISERIWNDLPNSINEAEVQASPFFFFLSPTLQYLKTKL